MTSSSGTSDESRAEAPIRSIHAIRVGGLSATFSPRTIAVTAGAGALVVAAVIVALAIGDPFIPLGRVIQAVTGGGTRGDRIIVLDYRTNRVIVAALAGAALGIAGALMQSVTRNPLASPDILGITAGSSVGAIAVIALNGGDVSDHPWAIPVGALVGGLVIAFTISVVSSGMDPLRLVLSGIALGTLCTAAITYLLSYVNSDVANVAFGWMAGSLNARGEQHIWPVLGGLVLAALVLTPLSRRTSMLSLGEARAASVGIDVPRTERSLLLVSVVLASLATAATGPIGFVAFVAPQIVRSIARSAAPPVLGSALGGAFIVVAADAAARSIIPWTAPIGAVTSVIGAPVLIFYLWRSTRV